MSDDPLADLILSKGLKKTIPICVDLWGLTDEYKLTPKDLAEIVSLWAKDSEGEI